MKSLRPLLLLLLLAPAALLPACEGSSVDTSAPLMTVNRLFPQELETVEGCGASLEALVLRTGQSLRFEVLLDDDDELSQVKVDIHANFDCHGHSQDKSSVDWSKLEIRDLEGASSSELFEFAVPANTTAGLYHFQITALDQAGNQSPFYIQNLMIINVSDTVAPLLEMTEPSGSSLTTQENQITLRGSFSDNLPLGILGQDSKIEVSLIALDNGNSYYHYPEANDYQIIDEYSASFEMELSFGVLTSSAYRVRVRAFDQVRNASGDIVFDVTKN